MSTHNLTTYHCLVCCPWVEPPGVCDSLAALPASARALHPPQSSPKRSLENQSLRLPFLFPEPSTRSPSHLEWRLYVACPAPCVGSLLLFWSVPCSFPPPSFFSSCLGASVLACLERSCPRYLPGLRPHVFRPLHPVSEVSFTHLQPSLPSLPACFFLYSAYHHQMYFIF